MSLSHAYGDPPSREQASAVLLRALDLGITHFDTAALYGFGANEKLLGKILGPYRSRFTLASKGGMYGVPVNGVTKRMIDARSETLTANCEASLRNLRTEIIDLYYLHRVDHEVPLEDSVGALARLVQAGKIRQVGLSEVSAQTLRRAHRVHPIAAVQSEYSIITRNPEIGVLDACRELGASFVAFSPVARGMTAQTPPDATQLQTNDIRRAMPRFAPGNHAANYQSLAAFRELAGRLKCTSSQLALRWLLERGPHVLTIPGTTRLAHLEENVAAATIELTETSRAELNTLVDSLEIRGARYNSATQAEIDTEQWPGEIDAQWDSE